MEITFKYQGKIISTPNLEKKLKRMKISIDDIEIIPNKKEKKIESGLDSFYENKVQVIVRSTEDDIRRVCFIDKNKSRPLISELFKNVIWNSESKTGIKGMTTEFLNTMYYES